MFKLDDCVQLNELGLKRIKEYQAEPWFVNRELKVRDMFGSLCVSCDDHSPYVVLSKTTATWFEPLEIFEFEDIESQIV